MKIKIFKIKGILLREGNYFIYDGDIYEVYKTGYTLFHKHRYVFARHRKDYLYFYEKYKEMRFMIGTLTQDLEVQLLKIK